MMGETEEEKGPSKRAPSSPLKAFLAKLRKRRIIETLAAFIGGGWLTYEIVHWILVAHFHLPEKLLDITLITLLGSLLATLVWRWFSGREKPRKFRLELVLVPLVLSITVLLDVNLLLHLKTTESEILPAADWKNSIAVLPFVDMSPQKDQEYFCDGMTEDLINRLSNIRELKVPARTSAFMFKGKTPDIREVGEKLKVQTALEGSIQKSGSRLRITAQLINIADGYHLWSQKYDRELEDVFAIQDEITSAIVDALRLELTSKEKTRITKHEIDDMAAYECYLRAHHEIWRFREDALDRAVRDLQKGLDIIGDNPLLLSAMAEAYAQYVNIGLRQEEYITKAEEYAKRALALDPNFPQANYVMGHLSMWSGGLLTGIRYFKKALTEDPNEPRALRGLAMLYLDVGKDSSALPLIERLKKSNPLDPDIDNVQATSYINQGQFSLALDPLRKWYQSDPENPAKGLIYALMLAYNRKFDEALSIIDRSTNATPNNALSKIGLLFKYGLLKDKEKAFQIMDPDFKKTCQRDLDWSYYVAVAFALLNEKKEALDWLENAVRLGFINYPFLNQHDSFLENVRGEERFKMLMERVKYEWEHFEE